jgi:hypothetical protein
MVLNRVSRQFPQGFKGLRLKGRIAATLAGAALAVGVPSAVLATGLLDAGTGLSTFVSFTPAAANPDLARMIAERGNPNGRMMRFTPAGAVSSQDRSVTVAVRVDDHTVQAISVRNAIANARDLVPESTRRIVSTRYDLGLARGYSSFAQAPTPAVSRALTNVGSSAAIPDLADFVPSPGLRDEPSRFAARIALEQEGRTAQPAQQTRDTAVDQRLDVAGSYRLTRNLDVTAGVRYEQDRDRLDDVPSVEQQDSQAVYIGTQFRF